MDFVVASAKLHAENYGLKGIQEDGIHWILILTADVDVENVKSVLAGVMVPEFVPKKGVKIQVQENENIAQNTGTYCSSARFPHDLDASELDTIIKSIPAPSSMPGYRLNPTDFEKVLNGIKRCFVHRCRTTIPTTTLTL